MSDNEEWTNVSKSRDKAKANVNINVNANVKAKANDNVNDNANDKANVKVKPESQSLRLKYRYKRKPKSTQLVLNESDIVAWGKLEMSVLWRTFNTLKTEKKLSVSSCRLCKEIIEDILVRIEDEEDEYTISDLDVDLEALEYYLIKITETYDELSSCIDNAKNQIRCLNLMLKSGESYFEWYQREVKNSVPGIAKLCQTLAQQQNNRCSISDVEFVNTPGHPYAPYLRVNKYKPWLPMRELIAWAFRE